MARLLRTCTSLCCLFLLVGGLAPDAAARHVSSRGKSSSATPGSHIPRPAPPSRPYPPAPGADAAAIAIATGAWTVDASNDVTVTAENHGPVGAMIRVSFSAASGRSRALVRPRLVRLTLAAGDSVDVLFQATPREAGDYQLRACASAVRPRETHRADDCITGVATAT